VSEIQKEAAYKRWANSEFRTKVEATYAQRKTEGKYKEAALKRWTNPEYRRKQMGTRSTTRHSQLRSKLMTSFWNDPKTRKNLENGMLIAQARLHGVAVEEHRENRVEKARKNEEMRIVRQRYENGEARDFWEERCKSRPKGKAEYPPVLHMAKIGIRQRLLQEKGPICEDCGADLSDRTHALCLHHKDKDKYNNDDSNLKFVCPKCHAKYRKNYIGAYAA